MWFINTAFWCFFYACCTWKFKFRCVAFLEICNRNSINHNRIYSLYNWPGSICTQKLYHRNCARSDTSHLSASDKFTWCVVSICSIHLSTIFAKFGSELNNSKLYHCTPVLYSTPKPYQRTLPLYRTAPQNHTPKQSVSLTVYIPDKGGIFS